MPIINVAKALVRRSSDGKYLILRGSKWEERPDRSQQPDLPGGGVDDGETPEVGCAREIYEEAGIEVDSRRLELIYASTFTGNNPGESINRLIYTITIDGSVDVKLSWEHEGYWWMTVDELRTLEIRSAYREIIDYLQANNLLA